MAEWPDPTVTSSGATTARGARDIAFDPGLRSYMLSVYNYMTSGVLLSGIVALAFYQLGWTAQIVTSPLFLIAAFSPLIIIFAMSFGANRMQTGTLQGLFWAFAALMGVSMSTWLLRFTGGDVALAFFSAAAGFAGLSLYGYTTQRSLSGIGSFLVVGLVGLLVAMLLNLFLQSGTLQLMISFGGVLIFAGLTAYDTQRIKSAYFQLQGTDFLGKSAVLGALTLYLDFINLFQFLLMILGGNRR